MREKKSRRKKKQSIYNFDFEKSHIKVQLEK